MAPVRGEFSLEGANGKLGDIARPPGSTHRISLAVGAPDHVGVEVTGALSGTAADALGNTIGLSATPFTADLAVTSSGPGKCSALTLNLSNLNISALGLVTGNPPVNVNAQTSGAVGSLLCNLGQALSGLGSGAQGLVNALNNEVG